MRSRGCHCRNGVKLERGCRLQELCILLGILSSHCYADQDPLQRPRVLNTWAHFGLRFFCRPWPTLPSLRPLSAPPSPPLQTLIACLATFDLAPKVGHVNNRRNARNGPQRWERGCVTRPTATAVNPRAAPHGSPERITARACASCPVRPTTRKGERERRFLFVFPRRNAVKSSLSEGDRERERGENLPGKLKLALGQKRRTRTWDGSGSP